MTADRLFWAIRPSFTRYVRVAGGTIDSSLERTVGEQTEFGFVVDGSRDVSVRRHTGSVAFAAHSGALSLVISDPWIQRGEDDGYEISVHARSRSLDRRVVLASGDDQDLALTEDGIDVFDGFYEASASIAVPHYVREGEEDFNGA